MTTDEAIADINKRIAALVAERDQWQREREVMCTRCGARLEIRTLTFVQVHRYVYPHGCSGGDYWLPSEGRFACPKCSAVTRMASWNGWNEKQVAEWKPFFARVENIYED